jgi:hypothetical protein
MIVNFLVGDGRRPAVGPGSADFVPDPDVGFGIADQIALIVDVNRR